MIWAQESITSMCEAMCSPFLFTFAPADQSESQYIQIARVDLVRQCRGRAGRPGVCIHQAWKSVGVGQ